MFEIYRADWDGVDLVPTYTCDTIEEAWDWVEAQDPSYGCWEWMIRDTVARRWEV